MEINFQKNFAIFLIIVMVGILSLPFNYVQGIEYYQRDWEQTTKADFYTGLFDKTNVIAEWGLPVDNAGVILDKQAAGCLGDLIIDGVTQEYSGVLMNGTKPYCNVKVINGGRLRLMDGWNDYPVGHYEGKTLKIPAYSIYVDATSYIDGDGKGHGCFASGFGPGPELSAPNDGGGYFGSSCPWPATFIQGSGGGGGGHGGKGGSGGGCTGGAGGWVCGSAGGEGLTRGSGGGKGCMKEGCSGWPATGYCGNGGGAIFLDAVNIDIRGTITMQGNNGVDHACAGGGGAGSGGMIIMKGMTIDATGNLNVNGGNGGSGASSGGGGGGGRIKIFHEASLGTINYSMTGGTGANNGSSGNFYTKQIVYIPTDLLDMPECVDGDLIIDGLVDTSPVEVSGEKSYCAVEITRGGILTVPKEQTLKIHAHSIYIDENSFVNVDGKGYNGFYYMIPPTPDIPADGPGAAGNGACGDGGFFNPTAGGGGGGASYAGNGGNGANGSVGGATGGLGGSVIYGDNTESSLEMGSGGGGGACTVFLVDPSGGNGGGAIFFEAPNISIFGSMTAKGGSGNNGGTDHIFAGRASGGGGAGSGGTIIIKGAYPDLSGAVIDVSGGNGGDGGTRGGIFGGDGGGGSGGRIKIFYEGVLQEIGTTYIASGGDGGTGAHMGESGANGNTIRDQIFFYTPEIPASDSYFASGAFASQVYEIPDYDAMAKWDEIKWSASIEAGVTDVNMYVRASDTVFNRSDSLPAWISIGNTSPVNAGLPTGKYIQFRADLLTSDGLKTPILHDVYIIYTPDYPEPTGDFNVFGWAWSDNIGWISFNYENCYPTGPSGCPSIIMAGYGVDIDGVTGNFSGYAWSENIGWISFESGDVAGCQVEDPVHGCLSWLDVVTGEVSGWARVVLDKGDPAKGWMRLSDRTNGFSNDDVYISKATKEFHNYAWSDDYGWISFHCEEGGPGGADICGTSDYKVYTTLPFVTDVFNLSSLFVNPCAQSRIPTLSWETDSAPFDYELEIDSDTGTIQESGTIATTNGSWSPSCQKCCNVAPYNGITFPNKTYNWRVRAKTAVTPWSDWKNSSFTTLANCYPNPDFTLDPQDPIIGDEIQLCSTNIASCLIRESVCYSVGGEIPCHTGGKNFLWDIPEIPVNGSYIAPDDQTSFNPKIQLDVMSDTYIILEITDTSIVSGSGDCSDNRAGCCAIRKDVSPGFPLPEWQEISPSD